MRKRAFLSPREKRCGWGGWVDPASTCGEELLEAKWSRVASGQLWRSDGQAWILGGLAWRPCCCANWMRPALQCFSVPIYGPLYVSGSGGFHTRVWGGDGCEVVFSKKSEPAPNGDGTLK